MSSQKDRLKHGICVFGRKTHIASHFFAPEKFSPNNPRKLASRLRSAETQEAKMGNGPIFVLESLRTHSRWVSVDFGHIRRFYIVRKGFKIYTELLLVSE